MKNPLNIRQNFYQGQSVSATNLTQLQDYSDNARNLIVSDILGYGIVSGFDTTKHDTDKYKLLISSGLAYTQNGVRLETNILKELPIKPFIEDVKFPTSTTIITRYLVMSLDYDKTKPVTDSFSNSVLTEWTPTATPVLYAQAELITMNDILLAEIQINEYGITDIIDRKKDFLDFNALTQKTSSFTTTKEEANTIASIDADIFNINNKSFADIIKDTSYPVKSTYTQYPNATTGLFDETETPLALFGGDWELVDTKLFNNVPEVDTNENGTFWKYPDRTLKVQGGTGEITGTNYQFKNQTFPYPFINTSYKNNLTYDFLNSNGNLSSIFIASTQSGSGVFATNFTKNSFSISFTDIISTLYQPWKPVYSATGYWKNPTDPISSDEEKNYIKIWEKINPPTEV